MDYDAQNKELINAQKRLNSINSQIKQMPKTSTNEYHIVEYGPSGGVLRKINPNISGSTMNEEGHNWTIDSCDKMRSNEYDPERIKKLMDIITYGQSYDLIAHNCQDIKRKILDALK